MRYRILHVTLIAVLLATVSPWVPIAAVARGERPAAALAAAPPAKEGEPTTAENAHLPTIDELKLGREGSAEAEKQYKILKDGEQVKRVQSIAAEVLKAADDAALIQAYLQEHKLPKPKDTSRRAAFAFSFKVADSKEVNAFSFAGGPIYITTGLLNYVQSDHELAAVIAHEIAHVTRHHLVQLIQKQSKAEQKLMWALLAGILAGAATSPDFSNVMMGAQLYTIAKQYGYGRDAERDADRIAVQYLRRTRFNPVGMLTVMKRFARDEAIRGVDLGIFQSHPYSRERAELITGYLKEAGITVDPGTEREISNAFRLETRSAKAGGKPVGELVVNGEVMFRATAAEGKSELERARAIEKRLSALLEANLSLREIRLSDDRTRILAQGQTLLTVHPSDAEVDRQTVPETSKRALDVLLKALWSEQLNTTF